ncbi:hypothetical protein DM860_012009 [Cuscuta australis]|uniref:Uncharacterized protein n=1 Tax=Cuscuta australis TaxID=267555 RepID=A0A328D9R0_9ASTE|nr:hypothetical protein DM860_012009 [Cuscuta australis]
MTAGLVLGTTTSSVTSAWSSPRCPATPFPALFCPAPLFKLIPCITTAPYYTPVTTPSSTLRLADSPVCLLPPVLFTPRLGGWKAPFSFLVLQKFLVKSRYLLPKEIWKFLVKSRYLLQKEIWWG